MRFRRKLTSAHLISMLALFVALGGTVYAATAINGRSIKKGSIPANRLRADSISGAQINEEALGKVPSARSADLAETANRATTAKRADSAKVADTAKEVDNAKHANVADNANSLGGLTPPKYQRSCESGALKGSVVINTNGTSPDGWAVFAGNNCGSGQIMARHAAGPGEYFVKFEGGGPGGIDPPVPAAVSIATGTTAIAARVRSTSNPFDGQPSFLVQVVNGGGTGVDGATFTLLAF